MEKYISVVDKPHNLRHFVKRKEIEFGSSPFGGTLVPCWEFLVVSFANS